jgi:hypothetical protein
MSEGTRPAPNDPPFRAVRSVVVRMGNESEAGPGTDCDPDRLSARRLANGPRSVGDGAVVRSLRRWPELDGVRTNRVA